MSKLTFCVVEEVSYFYLGELVTVYFVGSWILLWLGKYAGGHEWVLFIFDAIVVIGPATQGRSVGEMFFRETESRCFLSL